MNFTSRRVQQGAAMVEFAIMMIVLVPLLLYGFFISDAAYHQLEVQEAVLSTIWDFTARQHNKTYNNSPDWSRDQQAAVVGAANRMVYSDHTSSYDDPGDVNGNKESHHNQLAVHACFFGGAEGSAYEDSSTSTQITCKVEKTDLNWMTLGLSGMGGGIGSLLSQGHPAVAFGNDDNYQHGGLAYCWAKAWAYNFMVPDTFLQGFSHVNKLTEKKDHNGKISSSSNVVHSVKGQGGNNSNVFLRDKAAISFDTWTLDNAGDIDPKSMNNKNKPSRENEFYRRVNGLYMKEGALAITYGAVSLANLNLMNTARQKVIYIPAIPLLPDASIVNGVLPSGLGALGSLMGNLGLEPSNPSGVYMTARWSPNNSKPGYGNYCNVFVDIACAPFIGGGEYQTTPWAPVNTTAQAVWNGRGNYYMGSTNINQIWIPQ